jgi:hypothetical protein
VDGVAYQRDGMPGVAGGQFRDSEKERGNDGRAQNAGRAFAETVTMSVAMSMTVVTLVSGTAMRVGVH